MWPFTSELQTPCDVAGQCFESSLDHATLHVTGLGILSRVKPQLFPNTEAISPFVLADEFWRIKCRIYLRQIKRKRSASSCSPEVADAIEQLISVHEPEPLCHRHGPLDPECRRLGSLQQTGSLTASVAVGPHAGDGAASVIRTHESTKLRSCRMIQLS